MPATRAHRRGNTATAEGAQRGRCSRLEQEENGAGMSVVRSGELLTLFIGGQGGVETSGRGGDRSAAVVMAINDHPVQWGGEMEG
jgi:hypothetical protein